MSTEFNREERYIVFKMSDLGNSLKGDEIRKLAREYAEHLEQLGKKPLDYVVIEADWSEYGPTWKAIEARVTGPLCVPEESAIQTAARVMNIELIRERDALRAKITEMEQQEPVAWMQSTHLSSFKNRLCGSQSSYVHCSDHQLHPDFKPLYTLPGAQDINLSDPAVQKRLAAQWGYVPVSSIHPVINWLRNGCDSMKAAEELELIAAAAPEAKP